MDLENDKQQADETIKKYEGCFLLFKIPFDSVSY